MAAKDPEKRKEYAARGARGRWGEKTEQERFEEKVNHGEATECWPWKGCLRAYGYGHFRLSHSEKLIGAHVYAYRLAYGEAPTGLHILHKCDNRACCNPAHLYAGTHADNMRDMAERNRSAHGHRNGQAKLRDDEVEMIRRLYAEETYNQEVLAEIFSITQGSVSRLVRGQHYQQGE